VKSSAPPSTRACPSRRLRRLSRPDGRIGKPDLCQPQGPAPEVGIQAGSYELLLDDPIRLAARAAADDVVITLEVTPEVPHLSQAFAPMLDEGGVALAARFIFRSADPGRRARKRGQPTQPPDHSGAATHTNAIPKSPPTLRAVTGREQGQEPAADVFYSSILLNHPVWGRKVGKM
jgi:hypothetical protein